MGKPLIEAVVIESSTYWVGLTLLKPPPEQMSLFLELEKYGWLSKLPVPIHPCREKKLQDKNISPADLIAVRWFSSLSRKHAEELPSRLNEMADGLDDEDIIQKLKNALEFIKKSVPEGTCEDEDGL